MSDLVKRVANAMIAQGGIDDIEKMSRAAIEVVLREMKKVSDGVVDEATKRAWAGWGTIDQVEGPFAVKSFIREFTEGNNLDLSEASDPQPKTQPH